VAVDYAVLPRKRAVATMLLTDLAGRVLVVKPTDKPGWELPGESPGAAAVRELAEELGLRRAIGRLLALDYVPSAGKRTEGSVVVFDGGAIEDAGQVRLAVDELSQWAFIEADRLGEYLPPLQHRRALAALRARRDGQALYLEEGVPFYPFPAQPSVPTSMKSRESLSRAVPRRGQTSDWCPPRMGTRRRLPAGRGEDLGPLCRHRPRHAPDPGVRSRPEIRW
jgi:8-oxo-dGTP diphosphatase